MHLSKAVCKACPNHGIYIVSRLAFLIKGAIAISEFVNSAINAYCG